ncbi:uncharacterized protein V1510DRAFT_126991 [Dipodascopsis tothii]|uniref:uncharacterized protein n=1 Tax=Dipodascopsis tothii TaxID=44089 RepID=UPI0034CE8E1E
MGICNRAAARYRGWRRKPRHRLRLLCGGWGLAPAAACRRADGGAQWQTPSRRVDWRAGQRARVGTAAGRRSTLKRTRALQEPSWRPCHSAGAGQGWAPGGLQAGGSGETCVPGATCGPADPAAARTDPAPRPWCPDRTDRTDRADQTDQVRRPVRVRSRSGRSAPSPHRLAQSATLSAPSQRTASVSLWSQSLPSHGPDTPAASTRASGRLRLPRSDSCQLPTPSVHRAGSLGAPAPAPPAPLLIVQQFIPL